MSINSSKHIGIFCCLALLFIISIGNAQENTQKSTYLISYLLDLENRFSIKFSYADAYIQNVEITVPETGSLDEILDSIISQTQLTIKKLNARYYTLIKNSTLTICGIVLNNFEQNTVTGATVEILGTDMAVITDLDGSFTLSDVPHDANIQIKHLGFKTLFVDAGNLVNTNDCATLLLARFYQQLEEVVIYEFLTKGLTKQFDASIQLNTEAFGILPGLTEPDVLQTIQALPGIKSIDETVSDINIRGGSNDQNLLLWDGIKMYQSGHFFGLISAFNPYLTDQVTLVKNGSSAQYGDGVSGIIDMRTKNEITSSYYGGAGFNLISGDLYGQVPLNNKLAFQFSGRRALTDFLDTPTFNSFFNRAFLGERVVGGTAQTVNTERTDTFYFYDFTGKLLYDIDPKQKLRFSFININNLLDYNERSLDRNEETKSALDQTNLSFGGSLESNWTDRFTTFLNIYHTHYNLDARNSAANAQQTLFQNNKVIEQSLKLNTNFELTKTLNWLNGYQLTETSITNETNVSQPPFKSNVRNIIKIHAFFSELAYGSPNQRLHAKAGARLNYYDNPNTFTEFVVEPRLNINYAITKELKAIFLGEFKSQATHQIVDLEQHFLGIEKRRWVISDGRNLPIAKSKQVSLGLNYDQKNLYIGLEGFYKQVDGISTSTQGFQNQNQFNGELGKYAIKGVEFLINKKASDYSIWAGYTYNYNTYTFGAIAPPNFPNNFDIRHTATLAGTYTLNTWKIGVGLNYRTGKPFTAPLADNPIDTPFFPARINYGEPNNRRLGEYLRADASVVYSFDLGSEIKAEMGASVLNFTDRTNILDLYYSLNDANELQEVENTSLGITPNFSFRVKF